MPLPHLQTTAPAAALTADARGQVPMVALVIVDCEKEPWRVGQLAFFPPSKARLIGRGGEPIEDYASFDWQQPGDPFPPQLGIAGCLRGDSLSRCQAKVIASAVDLEIENLKPCPMVHNGKEVTRATVRPGETIGFAGEVVFQCQLRLPQLPPLRHATIAHPRGGRDAAGSVGEGPAAWHLRDEAARLGKGSDFVLILGESGTGKTATAQLIHLASARANGPFIVRNSLNLTGSLLESELFGKIANFPNPGPAVEGILPAAEGGTLCLDEIGRLPPEAQGHLLLALDNGSYQRLGESKPRKVDVRFIGATNLERSALQDDFQYRFPADLRVVPLRERREDIMLLAREMVRRRLARDASLMRLFTKGPGGELYPRMSGRLVDFLVRHELPGNTRQLDGLLEAAIGRSNENRIEMLPGGGISPSVRPAATAPVSEAPSTPRDAEDAEPKVAVTKEAVLAALESAKGNNARAAKKLGIQRSKFYRIKRELGIEGPEDDE